MEKVTKCAGRVRRCRQKECGYSIQVTEQVVDKIVRIVGGGLAGAEAAYELARRGVSVDLYEMRPHRFTEADVTGDFGDPLRSNSALQSR